MGSALAVLIALAGCSDDAANPASGRSMDPLASRNRDADRLDHEAEQWTQHENQAPRIVAVRFDPPWPKAGQSVTATVEAEDPEGETIVYEYSWRVGDTVLAGGGPTLNFLRAKKGDPIEVAVVATDGRARSETFRATTRMENSAPQIRGLEIQPEGPVAAGQEIKVDPMGVDLDDDPISYRYLWWVNNSTVDQEGPVLSTVGLRRGDRIRVRVTGTDGEELSEAFESDEIVLANAVPVIVSEPVAPGSDGVFRYQVRAEDPDGDRPLRYSLGVAPEGMVMHSRGTSIEWRPRADQAGNHTVEVVVEDPEGGRGIQRFQVVVGQPADRAAETAPAAPAS
jgi:hypothetical protein